MLRDVQLTKPIHLVPGRSFQGSLHEVRGTTTTMPTGLDQIIHDLKVRPDGAPAVISGSREKPVLQLHTYNYVVHLTVSDQQDFYWVNRVKPLGLRAHAALVEGCLLVRCGWRIAARPRDIPQDSSTSWEKLRKEWLRLQQELAEQNSVPRLSTGQVRFLDRLTEFNDIARESAGETLSHQGGFAYQEVTAVGDHGYAGTSTYSFRIVGRAPKARDEVLLDGHGDRRGTVLRVTGRAATVRFDAPLDHARLPQRGQLSPARFNTIHTQRRHAAEMLRSRQSRHRSLMEVLVDHQVAPVTGRPETPAQRLDPEQLTAFRRALSVRDLLVVLGPPGTGKTRVITEIAAAAADGGQGKTLVSSYSNKAVDNVLARLPQDRMVIIRIGREHQIDPEVRPFLLEVYAEELREELAVGAGRRAGLYSMLPQAVQWHAELGTRLNSWVSSRSEQHACAAELERCRRAVGGPVYERVRKQDKRIGRARKRVHRSQRLVDRLSQKASSPAVDGERRGVLAWWRDRRLARGKATLAVRSYAFDETRRAHSEATAELETVVGNAPEVQAAQRKFDAADSEADRHRDYARAAAAALRTTLLAVEPLPEIGDPGCDEGLLKSLTDLHHALRSRLNLLHARAGLLADWHTEVESCRTGQLHPELLRYADVIGSTCISAGSREEIAAEEFDLVVLDEAGQIRTSDALIPLVRGRRAVLVGDDKQLPPVPEPAVDAAIERRGGAEHLVELAGTSLLESLVGILPTANVVQLRTQRRMPAVIARFISDHFYQGMLRSEVPPPQRDQLFGSPLSFVDTSSLSERDRHETGARGEERGFRNKAEARLLDRLAEHYHKDGADWAVIVPYRAQLDDLKQLAREWADPQTLDANIGTVDAFQGGEREVLLYGFTRSNRHGDVGFLTELRRLNVALTRAKRLLVLVGDLTTLHSAKDPGVRELIHALSDIVRDAGDLRTYHDVTARLNENGA
ncbi:AAA domain-containing protein [Saccharopolyspora sp. NFXS83]|uniref:DEAD/DEAH box helicase n=1 Tax=Saccharopolyspora sp. NFXS83 TaxID=2993560 RepID=UPI00224B063F|nr:AAA domain-containing protein [Saccharopolyspora sp. NFXS83]MCX2729434.1 AAA domain-containing protein [Saccharopolyspora sp. NFXS83]